jgi:hypothetical protein
VVVELAGRHVGVAFLAGGGVVPAVVVVVVTVVVVVVDVGVVVGVVEPVELPPAGAGLTGVVVAVAVDRVEGAGVVVVMAPGAPALVVCAACAVPPASQAFSALDMASVLASSDSRDRQPVRGLGLGLGLGLLSLRFIAGTFERTPERRPGET